MVNKTSVQNELMSINVFSFDREEEVSSRKAGAFDVMIFFAIGDREKDVIADDTYYPKEDKTIVISKDISHATYREEQIKTLLLCRFNIL